MNEIFLNFKQKLEIEILRTDREGAHIIADELLKQIAKSAAKGELNEVEVVELIELYDNVGKWYA